MEFLVVSDNHGSTAELQALQARHHVDVMIHCGDSELPHGAPEMAPFYKVRGNCDFDQHYPSEITDTLGGIPFLITHGHHYHVKMSLMNLSYRAKEVGARVVCFGHSHIAFTDYVDGILFINPGSISLPRVNKEKTYAICTVDSRLIDVTFFDESGEKLTKLSRSFTLVNT